MSDHGRGEAAPPAAAPDLAAAALGGLCPRCGARSLFDGIIRFAPRCRACALDFSAFNVGDGPAAFLILIIGGLVTTAAVVLQLAVEPPLWLHILLWAPLTLAATFISLRLGKALLLAIEYQNRAGEARRADR